MGRTGKGRSRRILLPTVLLMPLLTILLALGGAKLVLSEIVKQEQIELLSCCVVAIVALLTTIFTAMRVPQKRVFCGLASAGGYMMMLFLSNLLFFGEGYDGVLPIVACAGGAGILGSFLGAAKRIKKT